MPEDVGGEGAINWDFVADELRDGRWCLDWWIGDPVTQKGRERHFYPRPRITHGKDGVFAYEGRFPFFDDIHGPCLFLGPEGCTAELKPKGCKILEPGEERCRPTLPEGWNDKRWAAAHWQPHNEHLRNLALRVEERIEQEERAALKGHEK